MESNSNSIALVDKTAIGLSVLCLAHCLLLPVSIPVLPFLVSVEGSTHFHEIFAVLVVAMAAFAFWRGFKVHGKSHILFFGVLGGSTLGLALLLPCVEHAHGHTHGADLHTAAASLSTLISPQGILTSVGGLLLIGAHLLNIRECKCSLADRSCSC